MMYLLVDDVFFSLKFGGSPSFERSLFTDTELDTCDPDLTLKIQTTKKKQYYRGYFSPIYEFGML